jgi:hypothetical protein
VVHAYVKTLVHRKGRATHVGLQHQGVNTFEPMSAEATLLIEGGVSGDAIICRSFGSFAGLKVTLTIYRENPDGSIERILTEDIQDADEHTFRIP